jgi:hypothetical protein
MKLAFTIKDDKATEVLEAFCAQHEYKPIINSPEGLIPNPESRDFYAEKVIREFFIAPYKQKKAQEAVNERMAMVNQDL